MQMEPPNPLFPPETPQPSSAQASGPTVDVSKMSSSERMAELTRLRSKMLATQNLSPEECRYGIRLLAAERVGRAGAQGGSKVKAGEAKQSFKHVSLEDL